MFTIKDKKNLAPNVTLLKIDAPYIVKNAKPGQFVILRVEENGERIPMTITEANQNDGTITIIFQVVGASTQKLKMLQRACLRSLVAMVPTTCSSPLV